MLSLYDPEKAYNSAEPPVVNGRLNGKSWRVIKMCYDKIFQLYTSPNFMIVSTKLSSPAQL